MHGVDVASVRTCQESNLNLRRRVERANAKGLFLEMQFPWIGMHSNSSEIAIWDSGRGLQRQKRALRRDRILGGPCSLTLLEIQYLYPTNPSIT